MGHIASLPEPRAPDYDALVTDALRRGWFIVRKNRDWLLWPPRDFVPVSRAWDAVWEQVLYRDRLVLVPKYALLQSSNK